MTAVSIYRFQEKDYLAVVRGAPSRAWLRQQLAREGAPRTTNNIFLNAIDAASSFRHANSD
jgi:hypothetical protein